MSIEEKRKEFFDSVETREITPEDMQMVKYAILIWLQTHIEMLSEPNDKSEEKYQKFVHALAYKALNMPSDMMEIIAERSLSCAQLESVFLGKPKKSQKVH